MRVEMFQHDRDDVSSHTENESNWPLRGGILVGGAFCAGIILMIVINREELWFIVRQFPALWSIAQNRQVMLYLLFNIIKTGIIFAFIALACCLLPQVLERKQDVQEENNATRQTQDEGVTTPESPPLLEQQTLPPPSREAHFAKSGNELSETYQHKVFENNSVHAQTSDSSVPTYHRPMPEAMAAHDLPSPSTKPSSMLRSSAEQGEQNVSGQRDVDLSSVGKVVVPEAVVEREVREAMRSTDREEPSPRITITLLKSPTMQLHVPGSNKMYPIVLDELNPKALQLIAYIAWRQGKKVNLGDMRNDIFGDDEMETKQVQESLNSAKRRIRERIDQAVKRAKSECGEDVFPADLDIFELANKRYWLPKHCRVTDLALIEDQHSIIQLAEDCHQLVNAIPEYVYTACMALIRAYTGDFIEDVLAENPYAFDPMNESWAREPFTQFRSYYLQAVLYAAEYLRKQGDGVPAEPEKREYYDAAAHLFAQGAMVACNPRIYDGLFDQEVYFSTKSKSRHGGHVLLSEHFIRRAIALYGQNGNTILVKRIYTAYRQQMLQVSDDVWRADAATLQDLEAALQQTGAYRFPDTIVSPHEVSTPLLSAESA